MDVEFARGEAGWPAQPRGPVAARGLTAAELDELRSHLHPDYQWMAELETLENDGWMVGTDGRYWPEPQEPPVRARRVGEGSA